MSNASPRDALRACAGAAVAVCLGFPTSAWAMPGGLEDKVAGVMAVVVLLVVPAGCLWLFWMVHIWPEKLAIKRNHPQKDAIHMLCMLSLVFGGLLWPFAFIWAASRPVMHKLAYGHDRYEHPNEEELAAIKAQETQVIAAAGTGPLQQADVAGLRAQLDAMEKRGPLPPELVAIRSRLRDLEWRWAVSSQVAPAADGENVRA